MKVILIDDEPNSSRNLERKLMMVCPQVDVIASCTTVAESVAAIYKYQPNLVFLDMELGAEEGFEVLDKTSDLSFDTIVVTMHSTYAEQAFDYNVSHFLTKPVRKEKLKEAVDRILNAQAEALDQDILLLNAKINEIGRIGVRLSDKPDLLFIDFKTISYCESKGNKSIIYLTDGTSYTVNGALGDFTEALQQQQFLRIHHQFLINLRHLLRYQRTTQNVIMEGMKKPLSVSNSYKSALILQLRSITVGTR